MNPNTFSVLNLYIFFISIAFLTENNLNAHKAQVNNIMIIKTELSGYWRPI